jgi:hypothetical protein
LRGGLGVAGIVVYRADFRQTKIQNLGVATVGDEDVGGLDVPMDDSFGVGGIQRVCYVNRNGPYGFKGDGPFGYHMLQGRAFEAFHGDEGYAILLANVVNRAYVGMIQCRGGLRFSLETCERLWIFGQALRQEFESDTAAQASVFSFIDDALATTAEFFEDSIVGDGLPDE